MTDPTTPESEPVSGELELDYQHLGLEVDGAVATLTIDRPKMNALDTQLLDELTDAVDLLHELDIRALVITGAGRAFVAGADIAEMADMNPAGAWEFSRRGNLALETIEHAPFVTIAAVNGFALGGGCELALACDLIYASTKAKFGQPEVNLGVIPGFGGTQRLTRVIGTMLARELVLTGRIIDAEEALRIGLAARLFEPDALLPGVLEVAASIASKGPLAIQTAKGVMYRGLELPLAEGLRLETEAFAELFATDDLSEGMAAFVEKREPRFTGE